MAVAGFAKKGAMEHALYSGRGGEGIAEEGRSGCALVQLFASVLRPAASFSLGELEAAALCSECTCLHIGAKMAVAGCEGVSFWAIGHALHSGGGITEGGRQRGRWHWGSVSRPFDSGTGVVSRCLVRCPAVLAR